MDAVFRPPDDSQLIDDIRSLGSYLAGFASRAQKEDMILGSSKRILLGIRGCRDSKSELWIAFRQARLMEVILELLTTQTEPEFTSTFPKHDRFYCCGIGSIAGLALCPAFKDDSEAQRTVKDYGRPILEYMNTVYGLKSKVEAKILHSIRCTAVTNYGFFLEFWHTDEDYWKSLDTDHLLTLSFLVLFDTRSDELEDRSMTGVQQGAFILERLAYLDPKILRNQVAPQMVNKYGARWITSRCNKYLLDDQFPHVEAMYWLVGCMLPAETIHVKFVNEGKVHISIVKSFWQRQRSKVDNREASYAFYSANNLLMILGRFLIAMSPNLKELILRDVLSTYDLILILGHWLMQPGTSSDTTLWNELPFQKDIEAYRAQDPFFIKKHVEPSWRHVRRCLQVASQNGMVLKRGNAQSLWKSFGISLGLCRDDEDVIYTQALDHPQIPSFMKCESLRCPLFGENAYEALDAVAFRCTGCGKATYCSLACQKTDWTMGRHRTTCKRNE